MGRRSQRKYISTGSSVEHPSRELQPAVAAYPAQRTAQYDSVRTADRFVNRDPKPKPGMPTI